MSKRLKQILTVLLPISVFLIYYGIAVTVSSFIPDTKYSLGYTEQKFTSIKVGMTEKQVLDILGEPLTRWRPYLYTNSKEKRHFIGFQYSESPSGKNYHLRQVYLDRGIVAEKIEYFYIE